MSEMTIDEAIADCVRQVPECASSVVVERLYDGEDPIVAPEDQGPIYRALWFDAAWEWLMVSEVALAIEYAGGCGWAVRWENENQWAIDQPFPTKYHALAAACKLAKGIKP